LSTYNGPRNSRDEVYAMGISADGTKIFVTGRSRIASNEDDATTIAYDSTTGAQLWEARYTSSGNAVDIGNSVAMSPNGSTVFVTGSTTNVGGDTDYLTLAYDPATGNQKWVRTYGSAFGSDDTAKSVGVSPDSSNVYVTGYISGARDFRQLRDAGI
jgi:putative pyrroloquinoline-quinone binding quinoprotein